MRQAGGRDRLADQFGAGILLAVAGRLEAAETRLKKAKESFAAADKAWTDAKEARAKLRVLEETNDGFRIAEADLALRGPGELLGTNQSGLPPLRFGNLAADRALLEHARALAARLQPGPGAR